jgi:hypothetical protein
MYLLSLQDIPLLTCSTEQEKQEIFQHIELSILTEAKSFQISEDYKFIRNKYRTYDLHRKQDSCWWDIFIGADPISCFADLDFEEVCFYDKTQFKVEPYVPSKD